MTSILLIENDPLLLSALRGAFEQEGLTVVAACTGSEEAMQAADSVAFDAVVTDLDLGDGPNGIVIAHALRRRQPEVGVVVLTSYSEPRLVGAKLSQLPRAGQYVLKREVGDIAALCARIETSIEQARTASISSRGSARASALTDSQIDTMRLIAQGMTNAEIARARFVTEGSVERTISRLTHQLGITGDRTRNTRVQITRAYYAMTGAAEHGAPTT